VLFSWKSAIRGNSKLLGCRCIAESLSGTGGMAHSSSQIDTFPRPRCHCTVVPLCTTVRRSSSTAAGRSSFSASRWEDLLVNTLDRCALRWRLLGVALSADVPSHRSIICCDGILYYSTPQILAHTQCTAHSIVPRFVVLITSGSASQLERPVELTCLDTGHRRCSHIRLHSVQLAREAERLICTAVLE
jgi:hypothetical protein